jgi:hypothetical protein
MKKVKYVAGAIGLAPMVLAAAAPGTAHAAVTATGTATGKTVSVQPSRYIPYSSALTSSLTSPPYAGTDCTGTVYHSAKSYSRNGRVNQKLWFWTRDLDPRICVGTVEDSTHVYGGATGHQFRLRIYTSTGTGWVRDVNKVYGATIVNGSYLKATVGVHTSWPGDKLQVCGAWVINNRSTSVTLGPVCRIVTS